ncbi:hypothetical protein DFH08DRAFT_827948 [Mycena albidolilacea]|uniref:NAD-specific glutamate dehydrogenase second domain-containing protein n=1 Tax=Mycena albidolilacea TaxID=1033008 RepID=A0AAD6YX53_9AGAR|nr:hypothetical protein DFH08DRAFT_827948 [Mycena albidolilacea]
MSVESRGESSLIKMQKEEEKKKRERDLVFARVFAASRITLIPKFKPADRRVRVSISARTASATESATPLDAQGHHVRVSPVLSHFQVEEPISTVSSRTTCTPQPPSTFSLPVSFLRSFQCAEFSNGVTIISLYLNPLPGAEVSSVPPIEHTIHQVKKEASLFRLPDNPFFPPKGPGSHAVQKATYACMNFCLWNAWLHTGCQWRMWASTVLSTTLARTLVSPLTNRSLPDQHPVTMSDTAAGELAGLTVQLI